MNSRNDIADRFRLDGERVTEADLPPSTTRRWGPKRKARVVSAVEGGLISREEARERYALSDEEYETWRARLTRDGLKGLHMRPAGQRRPK